MRMTAWRLAHRVHACQGTRAWPEQATAGMPGKKRSQTKCTTSAICSLEQLAKSEQKALRIGLRSKESGPSPILGECRTGTLNCLHGTGLGHLHWMPHDRSLALMAALSCYELLCAYHSRGQTLLEPVTLRGFPCS